MKSIESLKNIFKKNIEDQTKKLRELADLRQKLETTKAEAEQAALAGDEDKYHELHEAVRRLEDKIYVMDTHAKNVLRVNAIGETEVQEAWTDYEKAYQKKMSAALDAYRKHRKELCDEFFSLIDMQNDAIAMRNDCGTLLGMPCKSAEDEVKIAAKFRMAYMPVKEAPRPIVVPDGSTVMSSRQLTYGNITLHQPDILYFMAVNEATDEDLDKCSTVMNLHKHYEG